MKKIFAIAAICCTAFGFSQEKQKENKKDKVEIKQPEKKLIREGNDSYEKKDYAAAEEQYTKALAENPNYEKANYNLGNAIYQQNRYKDAVPMYDLVSKTSEDKFTKAESYHNMGNSFLKEKQYQQAVDAYKNSLRNNSLDDETRYNLAIAQKLLEKEQQKEKPDDKDNKDKDKNQDKDDKKEDDQNKDDKKKDDEKKDDQKKDKDKDKKGDQNDDKKGNDDKDKNGEKDKQQPPQQPKLSPQQVKQLLEAMNNEENKTQKKVNAKKAIGKKVKQEKDW